MKTLSFSSSLLAFALLISPSAASAQQAGATAGATEAAKVSATSESPKLVIDAKRGADPSVDYPSLTRFGPWDDRNYQLTTEHLALLGPNEHEIDEPIPAFFRVEMRQLFPWLGKNPSLYPRSALNWFLVKHQGYLIDGKVYLEVNRDGGQYEVVLENGVDEEIALSTSPEAVGEIRVTSPVGAAESAVAINPTNPLQVIAGANGPGSGQRMFFSTDGGATWSPSANSGALPLGGTCCDPTIAWSSDGSKAYTATLGSGIWIYRSGDAGQTWTDLETITPGDPRREFDSGVDKEYLHVDTYPTSPHLDNVYVTWHTGNTLKFSRSTDFANTWSPIINFGSGDRGIGSDITTDKQGNIYYFYPGTSTLRIVMRKSTDGGATFGSQSVIAPTLGGFDFPVPSLDFRRVFIYTSADTDYSDGPFANTVYVSWTDNNNADSGTPANNHARIQVAYSRDAGATWTVTTPHPTADINTVDRFHHWLKVGEDGTVHVIYYDTTGDASRLSVNIFHSFSSDGGQTWSVPAPLTTVSSPRLNDGFQYGDYNGLDIVMTDLLSIYTDNRDETGGTSASKDVYVAGTTVPGSADTIFVDGFESGDLMPWSAVVP